MAAVARPPLSALEWSSQEVLDALNAGSPTPLMRPLSLNSLPVVRERSHV
jgi:hypothetical protein